MPKRYMSRRNRCTGCARVMLALQDALRHSAPSGYATLAETLVLLIKLNSKLKESGEGNQVFVDSPDCRERVALGRQQGVVMASRKKFALSVHILIQSFERRCCGQESSLLIGTMGNCGQKQESKFEVCAALSG